MGVEGPSRKAPPLPPPTEPSTLSSVNDEGAAETDLATDLSTRTDKTSYSLPEGEDVTLPVRRKRDRDTRSSSSKSGSNTSWLIEYFEGGKVRTKPSVRVKVTPSAAKKIGNDHIRITETGTDRKPSYTKRISLRPRGEGERLLIEEGDEKSLSSYASATEESGLGRKSPLQVEVMHDDRSSSAANSPRNQRFILPNASEISSMPPDNFLETPTKDSSRRDRSRGISQEEVITKGTLEAPSLQRNRSLSAERRIAQQAIEKLSTDKVRSGKKRRSKSRSRSVSKEHVDVVDTSRRRSSRGHVEEQDVGDGRSLYTNSQLSGRSGDNRSFRSGTSGSSIRNPKLVEAVEDTIKRLVLPELASLRKAQKARENREIFENGRRDSSVSVESATRESRRRVSHSSSAPDVNAPRVVLNSGEVGGGEVLSGSTKKSKRHRNSDKGVADSPSERSFERGVSEETMTDGKIQKKRSKDKHRLEEAGLLTGAAGLTAAALSNHESKEKRERRKKRRSSKSRSRSASVTESVDTIQHGGLPPMPMSSDIQSSDVTRTSIRTADTERPISAAEQDRSTPIRKSHSPNSRTKTPIDIQRGLGTQHSNLSHGDLSMKSAKSDRSLGKGELGTKAAEAALIGAGLGAGAAALATKEPHSQDAKGYGSRGLSPIQSVASNREDDFPETQRDSYQRTYSEGSLSSLNKAGQRYSGVTADSARSSPGANFARSRPAEKDEISVSERQLPDSELTPDKESFRDADLTYWNEQHKVNDLNRQSYASSGFSDPKVDYNRMTNYTDETMSSNFFDKAAAGQHVIGVGANPEYRHTPVAAQSAVASLHEASILDARSLRSQDSQGGHQSYVDSLDDRRIDSNRYEGADRGLALSQSDGPTKRQPHASDGEQSTSQKSFQERAAASSPNGRKRLSYKEHEEERIPMGASGLPTADHTMPELGYGVDDESDITTNPSIIRGPIGGVAQGGRDHWPYEPTPPRSNGNFGDLRDTPDGHGGINATEAGILGAATAAGAGLGVAGLSGDRGLSPGQDQYGVDSKRDLPNNIENDHVTDGVNGLGGPRDIGGVRDSYQSGFTVPPTPPIKDEGYITADPNAHSPGPPVDPLDKYGKAPKLFDEGDLRGLDPVDGDDDPFVGQGHTRHLSGYSHGMPSPLYDGATGKGLDRIQSRDVVALMDHLTVRDAQRNARDTEILITLVRSAAEMRNSFEDMKRMMLDSEQNILTVTDKNTERTIQKHIQGPRPQPLGSPRVPRRVSEENEDTPAKRRNVFKRALKGLSGRNDSDLARIEEMFHHLLDEVEGLKAVQEGRPSGARTRSLDSYDNIQGAQDGYEPEGHAGTSTATHSGYFSNPPSRQAGGMRSSDGRRHSENRISTVPEEAEEQAAYQDGYDGERQYAKEPQYPNDQRQYSDPEQRLTPSQELPRGLSVPLDTPPKIPAAQPLSNSNENTPRSDRSRKHGSFFPHAISRWSKTTASTVAQPFRSSGRKDKYTDPHSRSGSEADYWGNDAPPLPSDKLHMTYSLDDLPEPREALDQRPNSPLLPQHSEPDEDPRYQVHRNSQNLQHPQPRPTARYHNHLETQAQNFSPVSPTSEQWVGSHSNLGRYSAGSAASHQQQRQQRNMSPTSTHSQADSISGSGRHAPPRPPKDPLVPQRPPKVSATDGLEHFLSPEEAENVRFSSASEGRGSGAETPRKVRGPREMVGSGRRKRG